MKKIGIILIILFSPLLINAQEIKIIEIGEESVSYSEIKIEGEIKYYFNEDEMVASQHEEALWLVYRANGTLLEAHDTDGDKVPDVFFELNSNEEVTSMSGEGSDGFSRPDTVSFEGLISEESVEQDLVGDLSTITIPGKSSKTLIFTLLIVGFIAGYLYWNRKNSEKIKDND